MSQPQPPPQPPPLNAQAMLSLPTEAETRLADADRTLAIIDRMVDWRLTNPAGRWRDLALRLQVAPGTIYRLAQTDLYRQHYEQRRGRINDAVEGAVRQQVHGLFEQALDKVTAELDAGAVTADFALRAFDSAARLLGMGGAGPAATNVNVQQTLILRGALSDAREAIAARRVEQLPAAS